MDLINDAPIVSLNGNEFVGVEGEDYVNRVITKLGMDKSSVQNLYYHYMGGNEIMKSSILAVPIVIEKGVIIQPWRKGHNKNLKTGVTAAPISIGGIRYICCVVNTRNAQKKNSPYSIRLFDNTQIRDMLQSNIVHHSTTSTSQPSDTSNANPLTVAKVLQKYLLDKNSQEKDVDDNEDNNSTDTTNENKQSSKNRNMKQKIKLRESELKRIIAETIRSVVNENSFHRGYKAGRNLDILHTTDGSYRDEDIFSCLAELKSKLKQAEARAKMPQYGNEGEARNYLVAAIRGLQYFINCHY